MIEPQTPQTKKPVETGTGECGEMETGTPKNSASTNLTSSAYLFAFGFAMPFVILEPIYIINYLNVQNTGLKMVFLATPITNTLRITEGTFIVSGACIHVPLNVYYDITFLFCSICKYGYKYRYRYSR